ncbi:hypothetical protein SCUCBS95973_002524 [Sporothrix curviconia]|uniref:C2H2-type domain-containing protein n=1 Tax=Sporothrix curviconia TaxID=1260050 RepID=A0ABP0B7K7_9PEZI
MLFLGAQPGPGSMHDGQWEAAVEGTQNFADYSDQGDLAQDADEYNCQPARQESKRGVLSSVAAESVPMRRTVSKSSAGSFKVRPSKTSNSSNSSSRCPRIQTNLSASSSYANAPLYGLPGTHYTYYSNNGAMASAVGGVNPDQYLAMYGQGLGPVGYVASDITSSYSADLATGLGHQMHTQQHVDPACTQMTMDGFDHFDGLESLNGLESSDGIDSMVYEPSVAAISPHSWVSSSSRRSSPDHGEDTWSLPMAASPAESHDSPASSPFAVEAASSTSSTSSSSSSSNTATAATIQQKLSNSEGESARDHPLYKSAVCQPDGFYHCPWEGDENCNHKPEKLKCNYDKFVDSHLKPYRCKHSACENARFSSTACLLRHEREAHAMHGHGDKPYLCPHAGCDRAHPGFGFPRQWNLKDHMRRVHHDDGKQLEHMAAVAAAAAESTPIAISSSHAVSKGRKRKKEFASGSSSSTTSSSRKSSSSSKSRTNSIEAEARRQAEALAVLEAAHKAAVEEKRADFRRHKDALSSVVTGFTQPDDPAILAHLQAAQEHFDALSRISNEMSASIHGPYTFAQQLG